MASLNILIETNVPNDVFTKEIVNSTLDAPVIASRICDLIKSCVGGSRDYIMYLNSSIANSQQATGNIVINHAAVSNGDTITIGGVVITAATTGNGTTSFTIGANAQADAAALCACINANPTLSPHILAENFVSGQVFLSSQLRSSLGNLITVVTSDATAFSITPLSGGTGSPEQAAVFKRNSTI